MKILFNCCYIWLLQLNFIGVTVEPERRYIHFPSNKFMFAPVAVAEKSTPTQVTKQLFAWTNLGKANNFFPDA